MLLIHYDEIALKIKNRKFFEERLIKNIKSILKGNHIYGVYRKYGHILIRQLADYTQKDNPLIMAEQNNLLNSENQENNQDINLSIDIKVDKTDTQNIIDILTKIPGIYSIADVLTCQKDFDEMKKIALKFGDDLQNAQTFAIDVRRSDRTFPINSMECEKRLGGVVLEKYPHLKVSLTKADVILKYEITHEAVFVYSKIIKGIGGLPVGSAGKMVSLLSGGIDSPVASFQMMKRGAKVVFVHFKNHSSHSYEVENKITNLVKVLSKYQGESILYIVPFEEIQKAIISVVPSEYRMLSYRRFMIRIAQIIAEQNKAKGLITGDSLGQVASQTLENLQTVHSVTNHFVATPLIGSNKSEIMEIARKIKTYDISILPYDDCCSMFIAKHPATKSTPQQLAQLEEKLDLDKLILDALQKTKKLYIE